MDEEIVTVRNRLRWGPIWAGLFVVAAVQIVMQLFGIAIGMSAIHPTAGSIEGVSIWQGIWAIISTFVAFFCGGWFAAGSAGEVRASDAIRWGVAVWGFALTIGIFVTTAGIIGAVDLARALLVPPGQHIGLHSGYSIGGAWATFGTVLLALGCSIGGATIGAVASPRKARVTRVKPAPVPPPAVPTPTLP